ncbi:AraC family transcriptional regulator [Kineococcus sp. SYSU DK002]|uniref:AraC family transcriptional regulator n=1 Tax=Kineococcus sp. SYSU DK002 TaxID=3383123 RepID=UPI003D7D305F
MPARPAPDPVQRTTFSSDDEEVVTDFIRRTYAENRSRFAPVRRAARFSALTCDTPFVGADRVRTSIDYDGTSEEGFRYYLFFVVHAGSVQVTSRDAGTTATRDDVAMYPLGVPVDFAMRGFDVTTVRLPAERVHRVAEDLTGLPARDVRFLGITPVSPALERYFRSLTALVGGALRDPDSPLGSPLLAEDLARTAATAALHVFPNTTMTRQHVPGPGSTAPATIRRAVAHVDANAHRPLPLDEIAAAAGTGARALQDGFRRHLGTTPLGYVRRVRLEHARRELREADPARGDTVAAVAARWGFSNAGRFSAAYRAAFGEPPGDTLRR